MLKVAPTKDNLFSVRIISEECAGPLGLADAEIVAPADNIDGVAAPPEDDEPAPVPVREVHPLLVNMAPWGGGPLSEGGHSDEHSRSSRLPAYFHTLE